MITLAFGLGSQAQAKKEKEKQETNLIDGQNRQLSEKKERCD